MSPLELDAIQARADAATPGPWVQDQDPDGDESGVTGWRPSRDIKEVYRLPNGDVDVEDLMSAATPVDAEFIAHAREDVPALVAELRAAREREQIANSMRALLTDIAVNEILVDENIVWARELLAAYDKVIGGVTR